MKITDPDVIKNGEKDLISAVKDDLDLATIKEILKERIAGAALSSKGGEIVVHNNEIAFRLDFDLNLNGSLMFDRQGNYIPESDEQKEPDDPKEPDEKTTLADPEVIEDHLMPEEPEELNLDDINFDTSQDETSPEPLPGLIQETNAETGHDEPLETEETDIDEALDEVFNIDLPDYASDEKTDEEKGGQSGDDILGTEQPPAGKENKSAGELDDDLSREIDEELDEELEIDDFDELMEAHEPGPGAQGDDDIQDTGAEDEIVEDEIVDDEIGDILKESRDFWEQKKES